MQMNEKCVSCGRFMSYAPGSSWAQSWHYEMDGCPTLDDPRWQCAPCTEKLGRLEGNCAGAGYSGVLEARHAAE